MAIKKEVLLKNGRLVYAKGWKLKFGGKVYRGVVAFDNKGEADNYASKLREKGEKVRVVPKGSGFSGRPYYVVFVRK